MSLQAAEGHRERGPGSTACSLKLLECALKTKSERFVLKYPVGTRICSLPPSQSRPRSDRSFVPRRPPGFPKVRPELPGCTPKMRLLAKSALKMHAKTTVSKLPAMTHIFQPLLGSQRCCFLHQLVKKTNFLVFGKKVARGGEKKRTSRWDSPLFSDLPETHVFPSRVWQPVQKLHQILPPPH